MSRYLPPEDLDGLDDYDRMLVADMDDSRPIYEAETGEAMADDEEPDDGQAESDAAA